MNYIIDKSEVRRYLGIPSSADEATEMLISECINELSAAARPKYIYRIFPIIQNNEIIRLDGCNITLSGKTAYSYLSGCSHCAILGATLGIEADNLIRISQSNNMAKAVIYDACATDLIEKVCDRAQSEISDTLSPSGLCITDRFSPGYGDLSLDFQKSICSVLDLGRKIGVYLTNELLLLPTKSVTAFIGAGASATKGHGNCSICNMKDKCNFCKERSVKI